MALIDNLNPRVQNVHIKIFYLIENFCYTYFYIDEWNKIRTESVVEKMNNYKSEASIGRKHTDETKKKINIDRRKKV